MGKIRSIAGSSLVEYVIPAALVGLAVGLGMYTMVQSGNLTNFIAASVSGDNAGFDEMVISSFGEAVSTPSGTTSPVTPPSDPEDPVVDPPEDPVTPPSGEVTCSGGSCTVTVAGLTIDGIPEDFSDFIETTSSSIGTDTIAAMLIKVSEELQTVGTTEASTLATLISNIALNCKYTSEMGNSTADRQSNIEDTLEGGGTPAVGDLSVIDPNSTSSILYMIDNSFYLNIQNICMMNPEYNYVKDIVDLLYVEGIKGNNQIFYDEASTGNTNPEDIKNKVASNTTDILARLLEISSNY